MKHLLTSLISVVAVLAMATGALGQDAAIRGRVMRNGTYAMSYADVTYVHLPSGSRFETQADRAGGYEFIGLPLPADDRAPDPRPRGESALIVLNSVGASRLLVAMNPTPIYSATIFNLMGQIAAVLPLETVRNTDRSWIGTGHWDGMTSAGVMAADGVYYAAIHTGAGTKASKFVHLNGGPTAGRTVSPTTLARFDGGTFDEGPLRRRTLDESPYLVELAPDPEGGRFTPRSFTRLLNEGDNGAVMDSVYGLPIERILFVGNSYTFYNGGIDAHVRGLAFAADPTRQLTTSRMAFGGYSLEAHWGNTDTREQIRSGDWDLVILQEQSTRPVDDPELMYVYADSLDQAIDSAGAETGLFMTWERDFRPGMIDTLAAAYEHAASELQAMISPVGRAWQRSRIENPNLNLYDTDGSHPSVYGTYLSCCVFYAVIWGESPVGIEYVNDLRITEEERDFLQRVAWETVQDYFAVEGRMARR